MGFWQWLQEQFTPVEEEDPKRDLYNSIQTIYNTSFYDDDGSKLPQHTINDLKYIIQRIGLAKDGLELLKSQLRQGVKGVRNQGKIARSNTEANPLTAMMLGKGNANQARARKREAIRQQEYEATENIQEIIDYADQCILQLDGTRIEINRRIIDIEHHKR